MEAVGYLKTQLLSFPEGVQDCYEMVKTTSELLADPLAPNNVQPESADSLGSQMLKNSWEISTA